MELVVQEGRVHLNAVNVDNVMVDCIMGNSRNSDGESITVEGIVSKYALSKSALERNKDAIIDMLSDLPAEFHQEWGGGWSFLNACRTRSGEQWTGFHVEMEKLFVLGLGIEMVVCCLDREFWSSLPGGVPYYMVKATLKEGDK